MSIKSSIANPKKSCVLNRVHLFIWMMSACSNCVCVMQYIDVWANTWRKEEEETDVASPAGSRCSMELEGKLHLRRETLVSKSDTTRSMQSAFARRV